MNIFNSIREWLNKNRTTNIQNKLTTENSINKYMPEVFEKNTVSICRYKDAEYLTNNDNNESNEAECQSDTITDNRSLFVSFMDAMNKSVNILDKLTPYEDIKINISCENNIQSDNTLTKYGLLITDNRNDTELSDNLDFFSIIETTVDLNTDKLINLDLLLCINSSEKQITILDITNICEYVTKTSLEYHELYPFNVKTEDNKNDTLNDEQEVVIETENQLNETEENNLSSDMSTDENTSTLYNMETDSTNDIDNTSLLDFAK